jgi:hypothetical protein
MDCEVGVSKNRIEAPSIPNYSTINSTRVGDRGCTRSDIINIAGIRH